MSTTTAADGNFHNQLLLLLLLMQLLQQKEDPKTKQPIRWSLALTYTRRVEIDVGWFIEKFPGQKLLNIRAHRPMPKHLSTAMPKSLAKEE